jgi:pyridoxine 5-phosphate synthase
MRLAVNIDHFATIREARRAREPEPVLAALLAEQAGACGIVCHIRSDRRHIKERDLEMLRATIKTKLITEMAATEEMKAVALRIKPDVVSLVPERPEELTTEGGLDVIGNLEHLAAHIRDLKAGGIGATIFVDPDSNQISACEKIGCDHIEINTGLYADLGPGPEQESALKNVLEAVELGCDLGLEVHAGHGLDYKNIQPLAAVPEISEFSIGFAIVARSAIVGIEASVREMALLLE